MTEQISNKELAERILKHIDMYIPQADQAYSDLELAAERLAAMPDAREPTIDTNYTANAKHKALERLKEPLDLFGVG